MQISSMIIPILLFFLFLYGLIKKERMYDTFINGAKSSLELCVSIFPYLVAIFIAVSLFRVAGGTAFLGQLLSPVFGLFGIPQELNELILLRPFSGSGSIAILENIYKTTGVDSYCSRCASVIAGSSETVFYMASVYFAKSGVKKLGLAIPIALFTSFLTVILSCLFCRIL